MRRFLWAFTAVCALTAAIAQGASAIGPGAWDHVGTGATSATASLNGPVTALNTQNPGVLYAGGSFTSAGGNANAKHIARWNGSRWSALGTTPLNGGVFAIAYDAATGRVFAGGTFHDAGGHSDADYLAVWDGSTWARFCTPTIPGQPPFSGNVNALQIVGDTLYVGGSFADGAGIDAADYLVACKLADGTASAVVDSSAHAFGGAVSALTADANGTLYAGGQFINLESIPDADHVATYAGGGTWQAMGSGPSPGGGAVDSIVRSLTAHGTDVYVGTDALNVAGIAQADHVARWDGAAWHAVGADTASTDGWFPGTASIAALATSGSLVVAAGSFQNANGTPTADDIAYFDGTQWRPIGSDGSGNGPLNQHPTALGITGGKIYLGGSFTSAGGDSQAQYLAAYALHQPDTSIGATSTGPFVGGNVYHATGAGEIRTVTVRRGNDVTSYVKIQNDGLATASFTIKGTGGAAGITARYFRGSTNVTSDVRGGTYATGAIAARSSILLRLVVTVAASSAGTATLTTTARFQTGTPPDAVRFVINATG